MINPHSLPGEIDCCSGLTAFVMDLILAFMGDKSPKAAQKHAAQKQLKADAAKQKKNSASGAKQAPKTKK
jgi:hypothetical protein